MWVILEVAAVLGGLVKAEIVPKLENIMNWTAECQRYFIENKTQRKKNGEPKIIANDVRKLHISGNFIVTDRFLVNLLKRKAGNIYSVKERRKPERPWWDKSLIKDEDYKWIKEGSYTREQFLAWLRVRVKGDATAALVELETCPPDNLESRAA